MEAAAKTSKMSSTREDTTPVKKGGSCYSFTTTNTKKWYDLFAVYYFENAEEDDLNELTSWDENKKSTIIRYEKKDINLSITMTIHRTGTIMVQGSARSLDIWFNKHYPELKHSRST